MNINLTSWTWPFVLASPFWNSEEADTPDSPMQEFVSDSYQSQTFSNDLKEVQEGIKRLDTKKPNGT